MLRIAGTFRLLRPAEGELYLAGARELAVARVAVDLQHAAKAGEMFDRLLGWRIDATKLSPALAPLFNPAVQGFLVSTFALDPARLAGKVAMPILILQGQRDLQVSVADAERLKQAAPRATLDILPDTNHVLKQVGSDDRSANLATYAASDLPLAPGVVDGIARFVKSR